MTRMRVAPVIALLLLVPATPAAAQVGITAGGIYSNASVNVDGSDVSTDYRTGFQIGLSYATGQVLGLIFAGYYSEKGFNL